MSSLDGSIGDLNLAQRQPRKVRSAMGIGIPTIVTILVVLLLTTFAVLSLVSARSDLELSRMFVKSAQAYYSADSQATQWYVQLDTDLGKFPAQPSLADIEKVGYNATLTKVGGLRVSEQFAIDTNRKLAVTVKIDSQGKPEIIQWQVMLVEQDEG